MKARKVSMYRTIVKLRTHSIASLLDCMRYENMVPDTQADVAKLEGTLYERGVVEVSMRRYSMNPGPPNADRLRSFNVELISCEAHE